MTTRPAATGTTAPRPTPGGEPAHEPPAAGGHARQGAVVRSGAVLGGLALLALVSVLSLRVGSMPLSTSEVLGAFTAYDGSQAHLIVRELRLPRTLIGLGVGAGLAVAGVVMQTVTRNALASPAVLGINSGAAFAVVTAVFLLGVSTPAGYIWFAFAGALGAAVVVVAIGSAGPSAATPVKLVLAGAVLTALLSAWIQAVLIVDQRTLDQVRYWLVGSLAGRDLTVFAQVAPFLAAGLLVALGMARSLNAIALGDDLAATLGQRVARMRVLAAAVVVVLAGAGVAAAGPIAFVGLAVPHVARLLVGGDHRWLLPLAAISGPVLLLAADVLARVVARPAELEVGIVTAIVGAPVLVHLVRTRRLGDG